VAIADAKCKEADEAAGDSALNSPKLKEAEAIRKLSAALGEKMLKMFDYGAVQGDTLVCYFNHPAVLMEFDSKKSEIIERMKVIWKEEKLKQGVIKFKQIRAAVKAKPAPKRKRKEPYQDRATGNFDINVKDDALRRKFESIRKTIKEGHDDGKQI